MTRSDHYVSSKGTVTHTVQLKKTDSEYIKSAPTVLSYWFVDCVYYGFNQDLTFDFNYTESDKNHVVEVLIVADFTPLPPTTTTVTPSTTTKTTTTSSKPTNTTFTSTTSKPPTITTVTSLKPNVSTSITIATSKSSTYKNLVKREVDVGFHLKNKSTIMIKVNSTLVPYNGSFPYVCNNTQVTINPSMSYGYFSELIDVKCK